MTTNNQYGIGYGECSGCKRENIPVLLAYNATLCPECMQKRIIVYTAAMEMIGEVNSGDYTNYQTEMNFCKTVRPKMIKEWGLEKWDNN